LKIRVLVFSSGARTHSGRPSAAPPPLDLRPSRRSLTSTSSTRHPSNRPVFNLGRVLLRLSWYVFASAAIFLLIVYKTSSLLLGPRIVRFFVFRHLQFIKQSANINQLLIDCRGQHLSFNAISRPSPPVALLCSHDSIKPAGHYLVFSWP
jgi:hypothetical protein